MAAAENIQVDCDVMLFLCGGNSRKILELSRHAANSVEKSLSHMRCRNSLDKQRSRAFS